MIERYRRWLSMSEEPAAEPRVKAGKLQVGALRSVLSLLGLGSFFDIGNSSMCQDVVLGSEVGNAEVMGRLPGFPLFPVSKGFSITLKKTLDNFANLCTSPPPSRSHTSLLSHPHPTPTSTPHPAPKTSD
jgi:hypothetical protein